jgi:hypothetical protein
MTAVRHWIDSRRAGQELQLKIQDHSATDPNQTITITGGLPHPLPGCDIIMPEINQGTNGHTIDHIPAPASAIEAPDQSTQAQETNAGPAPPAEDPGP